MKPEDAGMKPEDLSRLAAAFAGLTDQLKQIAEQSAPTLEQIAREARREFEAAADRVAEALTDLEQARYSRGEIHARNRLLRAAKELRDMRRNQLKRRRAP